MELEVTEGCTCYSYSIDGEEFIAIANTKEGIAKAKAAIHKLIDSEEDLGLLQSIFTRLVQSQGEYESLGNCDCCGDHIEQWSLKI